MKTIAIIGRPNVGKSTIFNRLLRKRVAIVDRISGVTRDRIYGEVNWDNHKFIITDTGGIDLDAKGSLHKQVLEQIKVSIAEADLIIFVTDVTTGIVPMDEEISRILRRSGKDVIVAVNKVDNERLSDSSHLFSALGWDRIIRFSALHGLGMDRLLDSVIKSLSITGGEETKEPEIKIAVIGKPNVGKSTFINSVLNEERMIVDEEPGTTRDAVDIKFERRGETWLFIDTAGVRKRKKVRDPLEYYSVRRAYTSIDRADFIVLMIDGWEGLWKQDAQLLDYIVEKAKPCVIAVNKWDLVTDISKREYRERIAARIAEHWYIPVIFISALKKDNLDSLLDSAEKLFSKSRERVTTRLLNKAIHKLESTRTIRIYYGTQVGILPPSFLLFSNSVPDKHYITYVKNNLHREFGIDVPMRIEFRARNEEKKRRANPKRR